jgi:hypothetical protein
MKIMGENSLYDSSMLVFSKAITISMTLAMAEMAKKMNM